MARKPKGEARKDISTRFSATRQPVKNGRPKESRDRITTKFLYELAEHFEANGVEAIKQLFETDKKAYVQTVAAVIPKEIEITRPLDGMSDGDLTAAIQALTAAMRGQVQVPADEPTQPTVN